MVMSDKSSASAALLCGARTTVTRRLTTVTYGRLIDDRVLVTREIPWKSAAEDLRNCTPTERSVWCDGMA